MSDIKIFAKTIDENATKQLDLITKQKAFESAKIRIMSDVHAGKGCVIGFTCNITDKIIPNIVGVDLYCGMLVIKLGKININLEAVDKVIREKIPAGFNIHEEIDVDEEIENLYQEIKKLKCFRDIKYNNQIKNGLGTLGGGNHFIEIDIDEEDNKYLVIHSGSRNLGNQVATIYQKRAIEYCKGGKLSPHEKKQIIAKLKEEGRLGDIQQELNKPTIGVDPTIEDDLCYIENVDKENYLNDIKTCYKYAHLNRQRMALVILNQIFNNQIQIIDDTFYNQEIKLETFETLHNYIDIENNYIRKGAVSAQKGELLIIPINMRDGSLICIGKGNEDFNYSAPHGAGRLMSRQDAKTKIKLTDYINSMSDVYTTSVNISTIDEAPQAYKPIEEIKECIEPTVEIIKQIKPIYNFKSSDEID